MSRLPKLPGDVDAVAAGWIARRDAGLTPAEQQAFARWRAQDPAHEAALARYEKTWAALARPADAGAGDDLRAELRRLAGRQRMRRAVAATAVFLLLAGAAVWRRPSPGFGGDAPIVIERATPSRVLVSAPIRQTLPDGSIMARPSEAEVVVDFSGPYRRVSLVRGEAHFEVAKDPARPFIVTAAGVEVRAVGTAFSVQLAAERVEVLVTEGSVRVDQSRTGDVRPATEPSLAVVDAGRLLVVPVALRPVSVPEIQAVSQDEVARRLAWRKTRVEFSGAPLTEVVATLNRCGPDHYVIADPELAAIPVSGLFFTDDAKAIAGSLAVGFGIVAERDVGVIRLRRSQ